MDLSDSILALEGNFTLPTTLKEDVEAVQICGGLSGLEAELQQVRDLKRVNQELLVQTEELLQKEAREDAQLRSQFGTRWTRPQSSTSTKNLQDRLNRFAANLKQAAESDARIERSVRDHTALMSILDRRRDDILPKLMTSTGSYEDLFRKEIAKYDHICEEIGQNIEAQEQLLIQIQAQKTTLLLYSILKIIKHLERRATSRSKLP
ncbi:vacuolar-sorting protein BRO1-like [Cornus florida]|uniref:vacuolar-sorting protein BRO1-like n=1 Tax=Cornus florida TaxID=4283 RepID=UPI00289A1B67|nr:vacuolar-sorting protein BRO1-like [Cornus florida]